MAYSGFGTFNVDIAAAFDSDPDKIGKKVKGVTVESISKLGTLAGRKIDLAIIAVPRDTAQGITDKLVKAGVKGILNFSPSYISVPERVKVITIDIAMDLARLPYYLPTSRVN